MTGIASLPSVRALGFLLVGALAGCGESSPPAASPGGSAGSSAPAAPIAPSTAEPPPEGPRRKPFEIYSNCAEVVSVAFGPDAKAATAGKRTIAPSSAVDGPREADGNQTVWLLDTNGEPLVKVQVTRGMKRVEVGKSCRTLDAR